MKKFTLLMVAGLFAFAGSVMAQKKVIIYAADVTMASGEQTPLVVKLNYEGDDTLRGWQFALYLPDGISAVCDGEGEDRDWSGYCDIDADTNPKGIVNQKGLDIQLKNDGGLLYVGISKSKKEVLLQNQGTICTIMLEASENAKSGIGTLKQIALSNDKDESIEIGNIADCEFQVICGGDGQGINDIQAADATAPAYNLQGVRVNSAAKGVIIRDGKKTVVK